MIWNREAIKLFLVQFFLMKKVTKPHKPRDKLYVFTEGINYFETGRVPFGAKERKRP